MIEEKIGIRAHDMGKMSIKRMSARLRENGFLAPQMILPKAFLKINSYEDIDEIVIKEIKESFEGMKCSVFGCYQDLSNPDQEIRDRAVALIQRMIPLAKQMGAHVVGSEMSHGNLSEEEKIQAYPLMLDSIQRIVEVAALNQMPFAIEPVSIHPLSTPDVLDRVIRTVGDSEHLRVIFDAQNVLTMKHFHCQQSFFQEWLDVASPYIDVLHIKDFTCDENGKRSAAVLGKGNIDYTQLRAWAHEVEHPVYLVREGLMLDHIQEEGEYLKQF